MFSIGKILEEILEVRERVLLELGEAKRRNPDLPLGEVERIVEEYLNADVLQRLQQELLGEVAQIFTGKTPNPGPPPEVD